MTTCRTGCNCPRCRGLDMVRAADEREAATSGGTVAEAELDRLRSRVRALEAEVAALTKTKTDLLAALALRSSQVLPHGREG